MPKELYNLLDEVLKVTEYDETLQAYTPGDRLAISFDELEYETLVEIRLNSAGV
jgi:hypothetical protein